MAKQHNPPSGEDLRERTQAALKDPKVRERAKRREEADEERIRQQMLHKDGNLVLMVFPTDD
jgi:hypothetical protein